jgi:hypothetical protein
MPCPSVPGRLRSVEQGAEASQYKRPPELSPHSSPAALIPLTHDLNISIAHMWIPGSAVNISLRVSEHAPYAEAMCFEAVSEMRVRVKSRPFPPPIRAR